MVPGGSAPAGTHSIAQTAAQTRCDRTTRQGMQPHFWGQARRRCEESELKSPPQPFATVKRHVAQGALESQPSRSAATSSPSVQPVPKPLIRGVFELDPGPWRAAIAAPRLQHRTGLRNRGMALAATMHDWADINDLRSSEEKRTHAAHPSQAAMPGSYVANALGEHPLSMGRLCSIGFGQQHRYASAAFRPRSGAQTQK